MSVTLHILSSPHSPVHIKNVTDPFSSAVIRFIKNLKELGWNCIHYGIQGCEVDCETIICLHNISQNADLNRSQYNLIAGQEIKKRKKSKDIVLCFYGWENKDAAEENKDLIIIEPSIGYDTKAVFAPYRVFVSYAQMHMYYGQQNMLMNPSWTDAVIPNSFNPSDFIYNQNKKDYVLIFGRVISTKGIELAIKSTEISRDRLVIAGPGSLTAIGYTSIPNHVEVFGIADAEQRKLLMSNAKAILGPTHYVEPFGNMIVEGYLSGTPAITTDWGGFTETVIHGKTGFRCRDIESFVDALNNINSLKSIDCLDFAIDNYEERKCHLKFDRLFKKLLSIV